VGFIGGVAATIDPFTTIIATTTTINLGTSTITSTAMFTTTTDELATQQNEQEGCMRPFLEDHLMGREDDKREEPHEPLRRVRRVRRQERREPRRSADARLEQRARGLCIELRADGLLKGA
jgi:hypothetical protein